MQHEVREFKGFYLKTVVHLMSFGTNLGRLIGVYSAKAVGPIGL